MIARQTNVGDEDIERVVSIVLRTGVLMAAAVVLAGGIYFLFRHGEEPVAFQKFVGQPSIDRHTGEILKGAISGRARSIIQLGILLLIATPMARVAVALAGFTLEGDRKYAAITAIVLLILLYSWISGAISN